MALPPISQNQPIVDQKGRPLPAFTLLINNLLSSTASSAIAIANAAKAAADAALDGVEFLNDVEIVAGPGLAGGGVLGGGDVELHLDAGLDDLTDVDTVSTPPTDGQVLGWDDALQLWVPVDQTGGGGGGGGSGGGPVTARFWRQRLLKMFQGHETDGMGLCLVDWADAGGSLVGSGTAIAGYTDTLGGWAAADAYDGTSGSGHGWYNGDSGRNPVRNCWLGYDFGAPVTPTLLKFANLTGFVWTVGHMQAIDYSDDGVFWKQLTMFEVSAPTDHTQVGYAIPAGPGGGGGSAAFNGAKVHLSANYNPSVGTDARMLDAASTVEYDTASWWDSANGWFVVPAGVTYAELQSQRACFGGTNTGIRLRKNGSTVALSGDNTVSFINSAVTLAVVAGDTLEPFIYGGGGYTLDGSDPAFTWAAVRALP